MFKIKQKTKKAISIMGILSLLLVEFFPLGASALTISDSLIDQATTPETKTINAMDNDMAGSANKLNGPRVDVVFNGSLQQGSRVTAKATPSFFKNSSDPDELYFTWFIKHEACDKTTEITDKNRSCDLDKNNKINENDWKIAAAKNIIAGGFDSSETDYATSANNGFNNKDAGYEATPAIKEGEWEINLGSSKNDEDASNCYAQEPKSGIMYELRRVKEIIEPCPDDENYQLMCVASDQTDLCDVPNPDYDATLDLAAITAIAEANEANELITQTNLENTAWNAVPENQTSPEYPRVTNTPLVDVPDPYPVSRIILQTSGKFCAAIDESVSKTFCKIKDENALKNYEATVSCSDGKSTPMCVKKTGDIVFPSAGPFTGLVFGKGNICNSLEDNPNDDPVIPVTPPYSTIVARWLSTQNPDYADVENQTCDDAKKIILAGNTEEAGLKDIQESCTFEKSNNMCKHLFPVLPKDIKKDNGKQAVSGDGEFNLAEKQFWGADPTKVSTNGKGKDEERVVGLGVDEFSWLFSAGDQVGVVVEGDSVFTTDHADASYKRMWAFPNKICKALEDLDDLSPATGEDGESYENKRGFYKEGEGTLNKGFLTAEVDLNDCLEDNLLDPTTENAMNLGVRLTATPENPINDPNGAGDTLDISTSIENSKNSESLQYEWSVRKSSDGSAPPSESTRWIDITNEMVRGESFSERDLSGLGKKSLAIKLNLKNIEDSVFYLKVKLKIIGTTADGNQSALGEVEVRVKQQENTLRVYPVTATASGMLNLNTGSSDASLERCKDQGGKPCPVAKNEIIGLKIPPNQNSSEVPFSWTINGTEIVCDTTMSTECSSGNILFFPVLGNVGEIVKITAKGVDANNESVEVSKYFTINSDTLSIESVDNNAWPKLLGYYKDLDSTGSCMQGGTGCYPDLSSLVMETNEGLTVTLRTAGGTGLEWAIDGMIVPEYRDQSQIQFVVKKMKGQSYNIGLSTYLSAGNIAQMNNIRKALYKNWGVSAETTTEENQSVNMQLDVVEAAEQTVATTKMGIFGASLITHLPERLLFLFKISLTSILILVATGVLFSFIPETLFKKEV